ncbi:nitrate- and nitrite sensing domain-containing protein [Streptomyces abikoensis]
MPERTVRVRNRLTVSVAVITLAVLGASTFGVREAWRDLTEARRLAALASADASALALAHSLADERDAMVQYVAGGRADSTGAGLTDRQRVAVDRQIEDFRPAAPPAVRELLDALPQTRRTVYSGKGDALAAYTAYTPAVRALRGLADTLDRRTGGDSAALPPLARATEAASASRGLLLGALAAQGRKPELAAAAQRADTRTQDALADFTRLAPPAARDAYAEAVTGPEVTEAQRLLDRLTRSPSAAELASQPAEPVRTALTTRLQRMRGVEDDLAEAEAPRLEAVRHDAMTELERRVMAAALCLFTALFTGIWSARSVTRPLACVRLGTRRVSADPVTEEPIAFKGRDDEFAETARAVNHLQGKFRRQQGRIAALEGERTRLIAARQDAADERDSLRAEQQRLTERLAALPAESPADGDAREIGLLVGLSLRTLGLVERQLAVIEGMEAHEADPERLDTLFKLDHLATRMRRNSENLLVLAGAESGTGRAGPVPLLDVLRAASGEIERYQRVRIQSLPPHARLAGFASEDVSHLVAELLENATAFSPPDAQVQVSAWHLEGGEIVLCVQDEGIGMAPERLAEANALLADPAPGGPPPAVPDHTGRAGGAGRHGRGGQSSLGLGLYVVARLAARHGIRVQLREQPTGGVAAVVVLPVGLLPAGPPAVTGLGDTPPVPGAAAVPQVHLPGSIAEANSHTLRGRPRHTHRAPGAHATPPPVHPADPPAAPLPGPAEAPDVTMQLTGFTETAAAPAPPSPAPSTGRHARPPAGTGLPNGTALPKRTPKAAPQRPAPQRVRQGVDAEALRRKLAGFQRGAADGRRDAQAELAARDTQRNQAGPPADGGTPEEARG